jgi:hypothetical protein
MSRSSWGGCGAIAQLGERLLCKQEVVGSIPSGSTIFLLGNERTADAHVNVLIGGSFEAVLPGRASLFNNVDVF